MRVALLGALTPFDYNNSEVLINAFASKLCERGHEVELMNLPFEWNPFEKVLEGALAFRLLDVQGALIARGADKVIAFRFPAYCIRHDKLTVWLLHQYRQAYDLWDTDSGLPQTKEGHALKESFMEFDSDGLKGREIYSSSKRVSDRLLKYNDIASSVLYPPVIDEHLLSCKEYGDYIFYPGIVNQLNRQHLAVEAIKHTRSGVRLVIAGNGESKADEEFLLRKIEQHGVEDKVTYINRAIAQKEKAELFSGALGSINIPFDEDSYGNETLEAYHSRKPVISCTDAGGIDVLVLDEETGYIVDPMPKSLGEAIEKLHKNKKNAQDMGEAGFVQMGKLGISWDNVIARLLA